MNLNAQAASAIHWYSSPGALATWKCRPSPTQWKLRGHLPSDATLEDYDCYYPYDPERGGAQVYVYWHGEAPYVAIVAVVQRSSWLVMFDLDGMSESAFVVERPDRYLSNSAFQRLGLVNEGAPE